MFANAGILVDTSRAGFLLTERSFAGNTVFNPEESNLMGCHSQPAVVARQSRASQTRSCSVASQGLGGQDVIRLTVSGRMDPRPNGPRNRVRPPKPRQAGACPKPIRRGNVVSAMRHPGPDHASSAMLRRNHDLWRRCVLGRISIGWREHSLPQPAVGLRRWYSLERARPIHARPR